MDEHDEGRAAAYPGQSQIGRPLNGSGSLSSRFQRISKQEKRSDRDADEPQRDESDQRSLADRSRGGWGDFGIRRFQQSEKSRYWVNRPRPIRGHIALIVSRWLQLKEMGALQKEFYWLVVADNCPDRGQGRRLEGYARLVARGLLERTVRCGLRVARAGALHATSATKVRLLWREAS